MSLFEDNRFQWRETYFVLFERERRPQASELAAALQQLSSAYEIANLQADDQGAFDSLTLHSPLDNAAMDITYVEGDEVSDQVRDLLAELKDGSLTPEEQQKAKRLSLANARFDVFHFEHLGGEAEAGEEEDEALDPGSLLLVLGRLAELCQGVSVDPQSGSLI